MNAKRANEYYQRVEPPSGDQFAVLCETVERIDETQEKQNDCLIRLTTLQEERSRESVALWEETKRNGKRIEEVMTVIGRAEGSIRQLSGAMGKVPIKVGAHDIEILDLRTKSESALERIAALESQAMSAAFRRNLASKAWAFIASNWGKITSSVVATAGAVTWLLERLGFISL